MRVETSPEQVEVGVLRTGGSALVVVATKGRPEEVRSLLLGLDRQSEPPEIAVIVGSCTGDLPAPVEVSFSVVTLISLQPGASLQRNIGLEHLAEMGLLARADRFVAFFDDDFRPARDWLEAAARAMAGDPMLVGLTGQVLADGIHGAPILESEAEALVDGRLKPRPHWTQTSQVRDAESVYGCNMAFSAEVARRCRFDDRLPLYSWLEDTDYTGQARRLGKVAIIPSCRGVHLGSRSGRVPGVKLGYSQIANPLRIAMRGNMRWLRASHFVAKALIANAIRSQRKFPHVDYRGRLKGNLIALCDIARLRCDTTRVLQL